MSLPVMGKSPHQKAGHLKAKDVLKQQCLQQIVNVSFLKEKKKRAGKKEKGN